MGIGKGGDRGRCGWLVDDVVAYFTNVPSDSCTRTGMRSSSSREDIW